MQTTQASYRATLAAKGNDGENESFLLASDSPDFSEQQALKQSWILSMIATKKDLLELEERLTYRLTMRLGSMIVAGISLLAVLIKIGH